MALSVLEPYSLSLRIFGVIRINDISSLSLSFSLFLSLLDDPSIIFVTLDKPASSYRREYIVVQVVKSRERVENDRAKETRNENRDRRCGE